MHKSYGFVLTSLTINEAGQLELMWGNRKHTNNNNFKNYIINMPQFELQLKISLLLITENFSIRTAARKKCKAVQNPPNC